MKINKWKYKILEYKKMKNNVIHFFIYKNRLKIINGYINRILTL